MALFCYIYRINEPRLIAIHSKRLTAAIHEEEEDDDEIANFTVR